MVFCRRLLIAHWAWLKRSALTEIRTRRSFTLYNKANANLPRTQPQHASVTWLPYQLVDQVVAAIEGDLEVMELPDTRGKLDQLKAEVASRVKRLQKWNEHGKR